MSLRLSAPMFCDDAVDGGPVHEFAPKNHGVDPLNIPNIRQGIGIEQHQIGSFSHLDGPLQLVTAEEPGWVDRGRLKGFQRRQPGFGEPFELI